MKHSLKVIQASVLPSRDKANVDITLSVSKAKTFDEAADGGCKKKFKFNYLDKLPRIDQDFHVFGKFLHQILENFHRELLDFPDKKDNWHVVLKESWDSAYNDYSDRITGNQFKEAQGIVREYREILEEDGLPNVIAVEKPFYIDLNNKVLLNGFIDRIQIDEDGILHVIDYKTTKDKKFLKDFFQLMTYSYALFVDNKDLQRMRSSFVLLRHNFDHLTEEFTRDEVLFVGEKFLGYAHDIEDEKLWRANPQFLCKHCDFLEYCSEGKNYLIKRGILKKKKEKPFVGIRNWSKK